MWFCSSSRSIPEFLYFSTQSYRPSGTNPDRHVTLWHKPRRAPTPWHCDTNPDRHPHHGTGTQTRTGTLTMAPRSPSASRCSLMATHKSHVSKNVRLSWMLCAFSWSSWNSLQKMVCRLATELRALCPILEDTHLLTIQQLLAFVVWASSRLAHRARSCATVMPQPLGPHLHIDNETQHDLLYLQSSDRARSCKQKREVHGYWFC